MSWSSRGAIGHEDRLAKFFEVAQSFAQADIPEHPSTHLWEDEEGVVHEIPQGEGGNKETP